MRPSEDEGLRLPSITTQRGFWNEWNARHRKLGSLPEEAGRRGAAVLTHLSSLRLTDPRILEVGCATGWLCEHLSAFGPTTGVDLADEVIAAARRNVPGVQFLAGDFLEMDLGRSSFDVVVSLETIAHVKDRRAFSRRVASLLADPGHLILTTQNRFVWERSGALATPDEILQKLVTMHELKRLLRPEFEILRASTIIPFGHGSFLRIVNSPKLNRPLRAILGKDRLRRWKEAMGLGNTLVVLARKR